MTDGDPWFAFLDGRQVNIGPERWCAEVLGIHDYSGEYWIQLGPADHPDRSVVIRCHHSQSGDGVLRALQRCPGEVRMEIKYFPRIIDARHE
jgi:hypothetical protein